MFRLFFNFFATGAFLCNAHAQSGPPSLQGRVLDPTQTPIAGARVTAVPDDRTTGPEALSDQNGAFSLPLEPGKYTLRVAKEGFLEASQIVRVSPSGSEPHDIVLQIPPVRAMVTVTEGSGYLTAASSTATKTLTPLRDIPQSITVVTQELIKDQLMMS